MCLLHRCAFSSYIYSLCEEILSFWSNHCWFMMQGQSWSVPTAHLWLLFKKMGYQEENYNFWDFFHYNFWHRMSNLNEISSCIGTPRDLVLVYVVLRPITCKIVCLGFLIELIEQILYTIKVGEILWSQAVHIMGHVVKHGVESGVFFGVEFGVRFGVEFGVIFGVDFKFNIAHI